MVQRKTVEVAKLIATVNRRNIHSVCSPEVREGWNSLLEMVLHATGNYKGFHYLYQKDVPVGEKPGIIFDESEAHNHQYPDETRRAYIFADGLPSGETLDGGA